MRRSRVFLRRLRGRIRQSLSSNHEREDENEVMEEQQDEVDDDEGTVLHGEVRPLGEAESPSEVKPVKQGAFLASASSDGTSEPVQDPSVDEQSSTVSTPLNEYLRFADGAAEAKNTWDCVSEANESGSNEDKSDNNSGSSRNDGSDESSRGDGSGRANSSSVNIVRDYHQQTSI